MLNQIADFEWGLRLAVALVCGGLVGLERELTGKSAGWRTNMLIALGAAAYTLLVEHLAILSPEGDWVRVDPTRIIGGVITGIGFLGAGVIIQSRGRVTGITTAAAMWVSGAVGIAAGFGLYTYAIFVATITVFVLWVLRYAERSMHSNDRGGDREV